MHKTLLPLTLAIIAASAHGESNVTLYGIVDSGVSYFSNSSVKSHLNYVSGGNDASRWGLKGNEDIGSGLAAFFNIESGFDAGTGSFATSGTEFNRQAFVGLNSTRYGSLSFGRQYEAMTDLLERFGTVGIAGGMASFAGDVTNIDNNIRLNNSVKFKSANRSGLTAEVVYGFGNAAGNTSAGRALSAGFSYANGPFLFGGAYLNLRNGATSKDTWASGSSATLVTSASLTGGLLGAQSVQIADAVGNYQAGNLCVALNYGYAQYRPSFLSYSHHPVAFNALGLGAAYRLFPDFRVGLAYSYTIGQSQDAGSSSSTPHFQQLSTKVTYDVSRRSLIYLIAGYTKSSGQVLNSTGSVVAATANLGDSTNGNGIRGGDQAVVKIGFETKF